MKLSPKRIGVAVGIVVLVGALIWQFRGSGRRVSWLENYAYDNRDPYGANVLYQLLENYFPGHSLQRLEDSLTLPLDAVGGANYVLIGNGFVLDSLEVEQLLAFVARGNRALLVSRTLPDELMQRLLPYVSCEEEFWYWDDYREWTDTAAGLSLTRPGRTPGESHTFTYRRQNVVSPYRWQYIDPTFFCSRDSGLVPLGFLNDTLVNFARLPHGKGAFLLHSTPMAFSNLQFLEESALRYADGVFTCLIPGPIYWDEYSKVSEAVARRRNQSGPDPVDERRLNPQSPLRYVLSQPALTWAWYLLLALALLYLFFRAKRRQRPIPVLEPNRNTSLEFVETIGRLYFLQNNHRQLALQQMKLFRAHVRERYGLQARDSEDDFVEKLAGKSEIPAARIRDLLAQYQDIERSPRIDAQTLIGFHQRIDHFYKHGK